MLLNAYFGIDPKYNDSHRAANDETVHIYREITSAFIEYSEW